MPKPSASFFGTQNSGSLFVRPSLGTILWFPKVVTFSLCQRFECDFEIYDWANPAVKKIVITFLGNGQNTSFFVLDTHVYN